MFVLERRGFLKFWAAGCLAACFGRGSARACGPAGERITFGFGTYGMKGLAPEKAIDILAGIGFDSVELAAQPGFDAEPKNLSPARRDDLRAELERTGLRLSALMEQLSPSPDKGVHAEALERLKRVAELGCRLCPARRPVIQTVLGGGQWDNVRELFRDRLGAWVDVCRAHETVLAIKPHRGGAMSRPSEAVWLIEQIGRPDWLKLVYDYSHYAFRDMPLEETVQTALPHLAHVAVKDAVREGGQVRFVLPGDGGEFDYVPLLKLLHAGGYRGDVCCEVSGMVSGREGYDAVAAARRCYANLAPAFERAGLRRH